MADTSFIAWPFFEDRHRAHFDALSLWCETHAHTLHEESGDVEADCRRLVQMIGGAGWFRAAVPAAYGGLNEKLDVRTLCLTRRSPISPSRCRDWAPVPSACSVPRR